MRYRQCLVAAVLVVGVLASTTSPAFPQSFTTIDVPGAAFTVASGINNRGRIVGSYDGHGFLLDKGTFTTIDVAGALETHALGINDRGEIVGFFNKMYLGRLGELRFQGGFLLDKGTFTTIEVGAPLTEATGMNNRGQIVGFFPTNGIHGPFLGFLLDGDRDTFIVIDIGAAGTHALGINDRGEIVGFYNGVHGFVMH